MTTVENKEVADPYQQMRYKHDIEFKVKKRLQSRINHELPDNDLELEELLGCNLSFFIKWLKFCGGKKIDWDNVHLHHVRPINSFPKNKYKAFKWYNVYPLHKSENLSIKDTRNMKEEMHQRDRVYKFLNIVNLKENEIF